MKLKLSLSLLLISLSLSACSVSLPQGVNLGNGSSQQAAASAADIDNKGDLFDVLLLSKGSDGNNSPITPDQITSLRLDGQAIAPSSILLPGASDSSSLSDAKTRQTEAAKVLQGKAISMFGGNGAYTFVIPKTGKNSVLELQLKGQTDTYKLIRFANLSRGTFVLSSGGQITGGFNTRGAFQTKAEGSGVLDSLTAIFTNPGGYYALGQFAIQAFSNFYQSESNQIKVTTKDNHELVFQPAQPSAPASDTPISDQQEAQTQANVNQSVGDTQSPLLGYIGSWTLESDLLKALIPGNQLLLTVATAAGKDTYRLTASLASGSYSGESKVTGSGDASTLNLAVNSGGKSLGVQIRMVTSNRISIKLTSASGVAELSSMVGTEIFLKRAL